VKAEVMEREPAPESGVRAEAVLPP
jgi:hypothetical protein